MDGGMIALTVIGSLWAIGLLGYLVATGKKLARKAKAGEMDREWIKEATAPAKKTPIQWVYQILSLIFGALIVLVLVFGLMAKSTGNILYFGNQGYLAIGSNSMATHNPNNPYAPDLPNGDGFERGDLLVMERPVSDTQIQRFDIIAYVNPSTRQTIVHRVVDIVQNSQNGPVTYLTQGDANPIMDPYAPKADDVVGIYSGKKASGWGYPTLFLASPYANLIYLTALVMALEGEIYLLWAKTLKRNRLRALGDD